MFGFQLALGGSVPKAKNTVFSVIFSSFVFKKAPKMVDAKSSPSYFLGPIFLGLPI